jgi:type IV secretory pathway VirJ component
MSCASLPPPERIDAGRLGQVIVWRPAHAPVGLIVLFSDEAGWSAACDHTAEALRARGAAIVGVDLPSYLRGLAASGDGCHYVIAEIEDLSKRLQHDLGSESYRPPVLGGIGAGGILAYAALAQAPASTVSGAVVVDPAASLATTVPLCAGAPSRAAAGGGFSYGAMATLPGFLRISSAVALPADLEAVARVQVTPDDSGSPGERLGILLTTALGSDDNGAGALRDLPIVTIPSTRPGSWMAVIYSGDGGWRDLDKRVGEILARSGTPIAGVDSLRYFWRAKTPEQVAEDLAAIIAHYGEVWNRKQVVVIGYSFGAGIVPFAVNRLPAAARARVVQLSLLGLSARAPFEFRMSGWLGGLGLEGDPYKDAPLVLPELTRIDLRQVQCFYGEEERDTLCPAPELAAAELIRTTGGHHFDGDYDALAARIRDGLRRRTGEEPPQ